MGWNTDGWLPDTNVLSDMAFGGEADALATPSAPPRCRP